MHCKTARQINESLHFRQQKTHMLWKADLVLSGQINLRSIHTPLFHSWAWISIRNIVSKTPALTIYREHNIGVAPKKSNERPTYTTGQNQHQNIRYRKLWTNPCEWKPLQDIYKELIIGLNYTSPICNCTCNKPHLSVAARLSSAGRSTMYIFLDDRYIPPTGMCISPYY